MIVSLFQNLSSEGGCTPELDAQRVFQIPFSIYISMRWIARLISRSHLDTNNNPLEILLSLKIGMSPKDSICDCAFESSVLPLTVTIANRRNRDIDGKI